MVDVIYAIYKRYTYQLMSIVKPHVSNIFESQMEMHTVNHKDEVSLAKYFQQYLTNKHRKDGVIDNVKYKNDSWK